MIWSYSPNHFPSVIVRLQTGDVILHRLGVVLVLETIGDKGLLVLYKQSIRKISLDRRYIKTYDL